MTEGWIKLYRKFNQWEWKQSPNMVALFIHLLINANHDKIEWRGVDVERGQIIVGRDTLSRDTGITPQSIRTCINKLKSTSEITIKSTNKYSIITLCNYDKYQTSKNEINQQINQQTNQQLTNNQPTTNHKQEVKKERSKEVKNKHIEFSLPSDINLETWEAYIEMRKSIKHPMTEYAKQLIITKLSSIGQDKNKVLNQSIENGWKGVFPLKNEIGGNNGKPKNRGPFGNEQDDPYASIGRDIDS